MSYGYEYEHAEEQEPSTGRGRRRKPAQEPEAAVPQPQPGYHDAQWERSGLGWDPRAWNEAQAEQYPPERYAPDEYGLDDYSSGQYSSDQQTYYESEPDYYAPDLYARNREAADPLSVEEFEPGRGPLAEHRTPELIPDYAPDAADRDAETASRTDTSASSSAAAAPSYATTPGQGAFGAAGLAVVTGIGALVATPVLAIIVGLSQIGLAVGWPRTAGMLNTRRTVVLVSGVALTATALAYRLAPDRAAAAMGAALGVGFVFFAADQLFRKDTGLGRHRSEALAAAVAAAAFTVLPAGYVAAQRQDSALAGACALAAAVAVLCCALVGGASKRPIGIVVGAVAATALGALTAVTLSAASGAKGGAFGGLLSGLFAVIGALTADRLGAEGGDVRISSQALPVAYSAIGAVIAAQVLR